MSAADVELVREWFEGLGRGDVRLELCHPEIEIRNWAEAPNTGPYFGHEGAQRWWADIDDAFDELRWRLVEVLDAGDGRVVTVQRFVGRFRLTGLDTDFAWGSVITVRDGKIASAHGYLTPKEAQDAAGL